MEFRKGALESLVVNRDFWRGKRVFLTGHTGFKGGWLALWLADMGARVYGYALLPPTLPSLFSVTDLESRLAASTIADVRDLPALSSALRAAEPEIVLHLAAQSLVRYSYANPVETYAVNVMGTVHLLESVRQLDSVRVVVNVTTDKCYENQEWVWPYRENEPMGGHDPYSSSKGCSELVTAAYRNSFFKERLVAVATARAGNVIGGGDWAADRLVPDFLRALDARRPLVIRSPGATRPWQHVLEPISGYLTLAEKLHAGGDTYAEGWNFGPDDGDARPVQWIVEYLCDKVPGVSWQLDGGPRVHEAHALRLDSSKAKAMLGWRPRWNLESALSATLSWHEAWRRGEDMVAASLRQIVGYEGADSP